MAISKLESIVNELIELGLTERKIINRLKSIKEELIQHDLNSNGELNEKEYNKFINGLLFSGSFFINKPSTALLGYIKSIKKEFGSKFVYYVLSNILTGNYFYNGYHEKSDNDKSNYLMYITREKLPTLLIDYNNGVVEIQEP